MFHWIYKETSGMKWVKISWCKFHNSRVVGMLQTIFVKLPVVLELENISSSKVSLHQKFFLLISPFPLSHLLPRLK